MVWYSHLLKNFPQFVVIYTVKGLGVINKAEVDVFLEFSFSTVNVFKKEMSKLFSRVAVPFCIPISRL